MNQNPKISRRVEKFNHILDSIRNYLHPIEAAHIQLHYQNGMSARDISEALKDTPAAITRVVLLKNFPHKKESK